MGFDSSSEVCTVPADRTPPLDPDWNFPKVVKYIFLTTRRLILLKYIYISPCTLFMLAHPHRHIHEYTQSTNLTTTCYICT